MGLNNKSDLLVGIVIPVYMEEKIVRNFHGELIKTINTLPYQFVIYYIDDGSTDGTSGILNSLVVEDNRIVVVELSRNFGHQSALSAGLDIAQGDVVITLDGDGQHPISMIPEMINLYFSGYDIVQTQRIKGKSGLFKESTSRMFYWVISKISNTKIPPGTADFRLMSRRAVEALKLLPEYHRVLRGLIPWIGFQSVILPYKPLDRIGGSTKYSVKKMINLASDTIFSFSTTPIKISIGIGVIFFIMALFEIIYTSSLFLTNNSDRLVPGWTSLMFIFLLGISLILISVGVIGVYIGYVFQQVKGRPIYIIKSINKNVGD